MILLNAIFAITIVVLYSLWNMQKVKTHQLGLALSQMWRKLESAEEHIRITELKAKAYEELCAKARLRGFPPPSPSAPRQFTSKELATIRYYLHPDKTNGKTNDLAAKINQLIKESYDE